jgi:hypothetical protein
MSLDVFKETDTWSHCSNSICDEGPEVSWIFSSETLSCCTEWLAGITSREDRYSVTKEFPREGFKVRVDRADIQLAFFNALEKDRDWEGFPFTVSDCS